MLRIGQDTWNLYEWSNGTLVEKNYAGYDSSIIDSLGDIDADGDLDSLDGVNPLGVMVLHNKGNGTLFYDKTKSNGLPGYGDHTNYVSYEARSFEYADINNDGWLDICTGGIYTKSYIANWSQDYFYLSDGKGNWTPFSEGLPKDYCSMFTPYSHGFDMKDMDLDGDIDCVVSLDRGNVVLFENNYPDPWTVRELPDPGLDEKWYGYNTTYQEWGTEIRVRQVYNRGTKFFIEDLDDDGDMDIIREFRFEDIYKDMNGKVLDVEKGTKIYINWNLGNWTFSQQHLSELDDITSLVIPPIDIDQDGMPDLITSNYLLINDRETKSDLFIRDLPNGYNLRSGMYQRLEWSSKDMADLVGNGNTFNLSISYFGEEGPYYPLKDNITTWWTYWTVPDFPCEEAYLKVEGNGRDAIRGPIRIFSKSNMIRLANSHVETDVDYMFAGTDIDVSLHTDNQLKNSTEIHVWLDHPNGTLDLGIHEMDPGKDLEFTWDVPQDIFQPDCRLKLTLEYNGVPITYMESQSLNIISDRFFLEDIEFNKPDSLFKGDDIILSVSGFSKDSTDMTHSSTFSYTGESDTFSVENLGKGNFKIHGESVGTDKFYVKANCFGVERFDSITIEVKRSLEGLGLVTELNEYHTGELVSIRANPFDLDGDPVQLSNTEISWDVIGPISDLNIGKNMIVMVPTEPGIIHVEASSEIGNGPVMEELDMEILPRIQTISANASGPIIRDHPTILIPEVKDHQDIILENVTFNWNINGNEHEMIELDNGSVNIIPGSENDINIQCTVNFLDEELTEQFILPVNSTISGLDLIADTTYLTPGEATDVRINLEGSDGQPFTGWKSINYTISGDGEVDVIPTEGSMIITGVSEGTSTLEITVRTITKKLTESIDFRVFRAPVEIELSSSSDIIRMQKETIEIGILDRNDLIILPANGTLDIENATYDEIKEEWTIQPERIGSYFITASMEVFNRSISEVFEFNVLPKGERIIMTDQSSIPREGMSFYFQPSYVLEDGNTTFDVEWSFSSPNSGVTFDRKDNVTVVIDGLKEGKCRIIIKGIRETEEITMNYDLDVIAFPKIVDIIASMEKKEGGYLLSINVIDQYGMDITSVCDFSWEGDVEWTEGNISHSKTGRASVRASIGDSSLSVEFNAENDTPGSKGVVIISAIIITMTLLAMISIISIWLFTRANNRQEDPGPATMSDEIFTQPDNPDNKQQ